MKANISSPPLFGLDRSKTNWVLGILTIGMLIYFSIPKLIGAPASVEGFNQFSPVLNLDPTAFRIFTGISEMGVALLLIASLVVLRGRNLLFLAGYFMVFATMASGLLIEFFARPQPEMPLVVVAVVFILVSILQLGRASKFANFGESTHSFPSRA